MSFQTVQLVSSSANLGAQPLSCKLIPASPQLAPNQRHQVVFYSKGAGTATAHQSLAVAGNQPGNAKIQVISYISNKFERLHEMEIGTYSHMEKTLRDIGHIHKANELAAERVRVRMKQRQEQERMKRQVDQLRRSLILSSLEGEEFKNIVLEDDEY